MRILFDLSRLAAGGTSGGIKQTLIGLVHWLSHVDQGRDIDLVLISNSETRQEVQRLARSGDTVMDVRAVPTDIAARLNCDLVYCSFGTTDFACPGIPTVVLIVDLLHRDFPRTLPEPDRIFREQQMQSALAIADCFHVVSDFTAARLAEYFSVPRTKIVRTYLTPHAPLGLGGETTVPSSWFERPFFFYPANTWAHKNHELLLEAYARYRREAGPQCWPLILTGHVHESRGATLRAMAHSLGIDSHLNWAGFVDETTLASLYKHAGALVFPSLYEGFGLPLLEAMAADLPILASNTASIPEIVCDAALRINAEDPDALAAGLTRIAGDKELRRSLVEAGRKRLEYFDRDREFGRLNEEFIAVAARPARWRHSGYHASDGLTDPTANFALPVAQGELRLVLELRPLPAPRKLKVLCGSTLLREVSVPENRAKQICCAFTPESRLLTLQVPNAESLCATDPRKHGVLLGSLTVDSASGARFDLLEPNIGEPTRGTCPIASCRIGTASNSAFSAGHFTARREQRPLGATNGATALQFHIDQPDSWISNDRSLVVRGWCFSAAGVPVNAVRVRGSGLIFSGEYGFSRPDVQTAFPEAPSASVGFVIRVLLPPGVHTIQLEAGLTDGTWQTIQDRPITIRGRVIPLWLSGGTWAELLSRQMPTLMVHPPRCLKTEKFPRQITSAISLKLAIVTPSYQQGIFLEGTIRSVLEQKGVSPTYIIQDGGSTDGSVAIIQRYSARLSGWETAPDKGQADAVSKGFAKAARELAPDDLMAWINSDDTYMPGALRFISDYFATHPEVDVVYGHRVLIDSFGAEIGRCFLPPHRDDVLRLNDFIPQETIFWRRRIWNKVGGIDPSFQFAMDWDLLLRFQSAGAKIVRLPYFLGCFRVHAQQKTSTQISTAGQEEIDRLRERTFGRKVAPAEIEANPLLHCYLRQSAWLEFLWRLGIRGH